MNEFTAHNDWWSQKYRFLLGEGVRYFSFKIALNLFLQRGGKTIVETGTTRARDDFSGGGMATIHFGDFAQRYDKHLYTVDILPEAIELAKSLTTDYADHTTYVVSDSVVFLKMFASDIGLLYLDSMDCPEFDASDSPNLRASQEHQLHELEAAWDRLTEQSVVLLDDNNFENGGKCKLSNKFMEEKGWTCLMADKQVLWIK